MKRLEDKSRIAGAGGGGGGKGGGGGSSHTPTEAADSLRSKQLARVLDLVSEGEIYGLVDGLKSVYLDDTPLQNADLSYNFTDVTVDWRVGTQSQSYIPGFSAVEAETAVGVEVKASASVTRSISNASLSAVRVTVSVPQLTYQNPTTGDLSGDTVQIAIDLQTNGGGYVEQLIDTVSGKTTSTYQRAYRIELPGTGPWDVRVRRITADSVAANQVNKTYWQSYTEIIDHLLRYPNSGLVGVQIDASQFQAIPKRGYHLKGLKIRVPTNYDPTTRTYVGNWDGTFKIEYSNNPAWCWYDMIVSERYGLGEFIDASQVDKWSLYTIAQYCDTLVDNGFGTTEPRFTCNLYLQTREEAYNVLQNMASIFRGMVYEAGGYVTAVQDAPADAVALFTPANVIDGMFNYAGSSIKARHTVALVSWNDPADRYKQKIEYVEDEVGIGRYGVRETEIAAAGCTSRGQAHRVGKWLLYTERLETETITFRAGLDAVYTRPGDIIKIADPNIAAVRLGGRVLAATTGSVTIDNPVTITTGHTYDLSCVLPDGTVATRTLNNAAGSATVLTFATVLSAAPAVHSVWLVADIGQVEPQTFRVLGVAEVEKTQIEIVALAHNAGKYAAIEQGIKLEVPPITEGQLTFQVPVTGVTLSKNVEYREDGSILVYATASWPSVIGASRYSVELRRDADNWETIANTSSLLAQKEINQEGIYTAKVVAYNAIGTPSIAVESVSTQLYWITLSAPSALALSSPWTGADFSVTWAPVIGAASYTVEVWQGGLMRRQVTGVVTNTFDYAFTTNTSDGGPWRAVDVKVKAVGVSTESTYTTLSVSNTQINTAPNASAYPTVHAINVGWGSLSAPDIGGYRVYMSTISGFTPDGTNLIYAGIGNLCTAENLVVGTNYFFKIAAHDVFGLDSLVYGSEFSGTPEASTSETASQTIDKINTALSDPNTADKLILVAEHFAIQKPGGGVPVYPLAISNVDGIDYVALNADVIINGDVNISNLSTGALPTDVQMVLGGGSIVIDGAGSINIYKALGANQDYLNLSGARLSFQRFVTGIGYVEYNTLRRRESGVANSNVVTNIPGYWNAQPDIQVSINSVRAFDVAYASQSQDWQCEYQTLEEYSPGQWRFTPIARLIVAATSGSTGVNISSGLIATDAWSSGTFTTPGNSSSATFNVSFSSSHGAGTSGAYYYRSVRWRVHYGANVTGWQTKFIGATLASVTDSMAVTFGSSAAWLCYIEFEAFDTDATTFSSGGITYDYATDTVATITTQYVWGSSVGGTVPLNAYSLPSGWEIYQITYNLDATFSVGNANGAYAYVGCVGHYSQYKTVGYATSFETLACTVATSSYDSSYWTGYSYYGNSGTGNVGSGQLYMKNSRATVYRRKAQANTAIANQFTVGDYSWNLSAANIIASGALNWMAIGE